MKRGRLASQCAAGAGDRRNLAPESGALLPQTGDTVTLIQADWRCQRLDRIYNNPAM